MWQKKRIWEIVYSKIWWVKKSGTYLEKENLEHVKTPASEHLWMKRSETYKKCKIVFMCFKYLMNEWKEFETYKKVKFYLSVPII